MTKSLPVRLAIAVIAAATAFSASAQRTSKDEYQQWMQRQAQVMEQFKDERDAQFTRFLKAQWKEMAVYKGQVRDKKPKPAKMPVAPPDARPKKTVPAKRPVAKTKPMSVPEKKPEPVTPPKKVVSPKATPKPKPIVKLLPQPKPAKKPAPLPKPTISEKGTPFDFVLLGHRLKFFVDSRFAESRLGGANKNAISDYWGEMSQTDYDTLVSDLSRYRNSLVLNDWAFGVMVSELAKRVYPGNINEQRVFSWFLFIKSGYRARVGYNGDTIYLMLPSQQILYSVSYFTFDGIRFYLVDFEGRNIRAPRLFTYDAKYPRANRKLDLRLASFPRSNRKGKKKTYRFNYGRKNYSVSVSYDRSAVDFLKNYPLTDFSVYFSADMNRPTGNTLLESIRPLIKGKSESEAVNILLRFVQTAFAYRTDHQQFGKENYLFPEETLFYPYSDCEDRAFLFAWLVRNLLGLQVIGLEYPGHVATAVRFRGSIQGDSIQHRGSHYVVADPTYINARAGMAMPKYKNVSPKIISVPPI